MNKVNLILFTKLLIVLYLSVLFSFSSVISVKANDTPFHGQGSENNPFLITCIEDLFYLRDQVNSGNDFKGKFFKQISDIDFSNSDNWIPIGILQEGFAFAGTYNGNGHVIYNISCMNKNAAIFAFLSGTVRNLGIESGSFTGDYIGSIASHGTKDALIINCFNKADINPLKRGGGITDNFNGRIICCWNLGPVKGDNDQVITAEISSFGNAEIYGCVGSDSTSLVTAKEFTGIVTVSEIISDKSQLSEYIENYYYNLWNIYQNNDQDIADADTILVNRSNTVFLTLNDNTIVFDYNLEPSLFAEERELYKEHYLEVYATRFNFLGQGTKNDPFLISSYEDLCRLRDCVDIGITYTEYYFLQTENIHFPNDTNWDPIGNVNPLLAFSGEYNGGGFGLYNLYCDNKHAGLFSYLDGTVKNVCIESGHFQGNYIGSITSHAGENSVIINCINKADVEGTNRSGGISDNNKGKIILCFNSGKITGKDDSVNASICSYGSAYIENCFSTCPVPIVSELNYNGRCENSAVLDSENINIQIANLYDPRLTKEKIYISVNNEGDFQFIPNHELISSYMRFLPLSVLIILSLVSLIFVIVKLKHSKTIKKSESFPDNTNTLQKEGQSSKFKKIVAFILTMSLFILFFYISEKILMNKNVDGIMDMQEFYSEPKNKVDVLFMGSSRTGINIDEEVLWNDYGISSFNLWGSRQPFWNTYYFLKEAISVNKPHVIVLDITAVTYPEYYSDSYRQITNTLGIKNIFNRFPAVIASTDTKDIPYYLLKYPLFHERYNELTENDFLNFPWINPDKYYKGYSYSYGTNEPEWPSGKDNLEYRAIEEKELNYLYQIIDECKKSNIELIFIKTETLSWKNDQPWFNTLKLIADDNNIPFINFNEITDITGFSNSDFYTDGAHVNIYGARKNSAFIGEYLVNNYALTDHRLDPGYDSWNKATSFILSRVLGKITSESEYFSELKRDSLSIRVFPYKVNSDSDSYEHFLTQISGIEHYISSTNNESFVIGNNTIDMESDPSQMTISISKEKSYSITDPAFVLIIYDQDTNIILDISSILLDEDHTISHLLK